MFWPWLAGSAAVRPRSSVVPAMSSLQPTAPIAIAAAASAAIVTYLFLRQNKKAEAEPCCADDDDAARSTVFRAYEATAQGNASCCVTAPVGGSNKIGYTAEAQALGAATGADLGLGCGTPVELAALQKGETVCDLGAGGGFDVLLAAKAVGARGKAYGVDMVPAMLEKARSAAKRLGVHNAKYLLGEIEHLPLPDGSVDVVISNCVINLSPDKRQVCREAYRILKPGGRIAVSDVVRTQELPDRLKNAEALSC